MLGVLLVLAFLLGCSDFMSEEDYGHAWREAATQYSKIDKNPDDPAATQDGMGDGSIEAKMHAADYISQQIRKIADSIKDLKAPPQFQALQDETYIFYRGQSDHFEGFAQALEGGKDDKIATAVDQLNSFADEHQKSIWRLIQKLGDKASTFTPVWKAAMK
jgi:hypothetical protein